MHRRLILGLSALLALAACSSSSSSPSTHTVSVTGFWRPISEPNILLPAEQEQKKLDFDLSQCTCGIFPTNVLQPDLVKFEPDQQRLAETSVFRTSPDNKNCKQQPSLVVAECMRARGWEATTCAGRVPTAAGGSVCASAKAERRE